MVADQIIRSDRAENHTQDLAVDRSLQFLPVMLIESMLSESTLVSTSEKGSALQKVERVGRGICFYRRT
jgi:hypothetical protein